MKADRVASLRAEPCSLRKSGVEQCPEVSSSGIWRWPGPTPICLCARAAESGKRAQGPRKRVVSGTSMTDPNPQLSPTPACAVLASEGTWRATWPGRLQGVRRDFTLRLP
jgi:hypothetical protein